MIEYWRAHFTGVVSVEVPPEDTAAFTELIQRGANLWPDAPATIKEFADKVTNGKVLQDYKSQEKRATK